MLKELLSSCKKECKLKPCEIKYAGRSKIVDIASKSGIQKEKYRGGKKIKKCNTKKIGRDSADSNSLR